MSEIKHPAHLEEEKNPVAEFQSIWEKYGKQASYVLLAIIVIVAGFFAWRNLVSDPNEKKATEAMFRAEEYYRLDSTRPGPQRRRHQCRFSQGHRPLQRHQGGRSDLLLCRKLLSEIG